MRLAEQQAMSLWTDTGESPAEVMREAARKLQSEQYRVHVDFIPPPVPAGRCAPSLAPIITAQPGTPWARLTLALANIGRKK